MKEFVIVGLDTAEKKAEAEKVLNRMGYKNSLWFNRENRSKNNYTQILCADSGRYYFEHKNTRNEYPEMTLKQLKTEQ